MKKILTLILITIGTYVIAQDSTNVISQFGITWTFDKKYRYGQFANGDYWIVGPATLIDINPPSVDTDGKIKNGSEINPTPENSSPDDVWLTWGQGFDNELLQGEIYDASLNKGYNITSGGDNLELTAGQSLVSSISIDTASTPQLKTVAILTVLDVIPPEGSFRPGYCGTDKSIRFNKSDLDYSLLQNLPITTAIQSSMNEYWIQNPVDDENVNLTVTTPLEAINATARMFERPWLDHIRANEGRSIHPTENMGAYGREISRCVSIGAMMLHMNFTNEEKETLLIRYVQLGIDLYSILINGGENIWAPADGGHTAGRKWPILFAGIMLNDNDMKNIGMGDVTLFGEDDMTFYVANHPNPTSVWSFNGTYWVSDGTDEDYDIFVPNPDPSLDPSPENFNSEGYRKHEAYGFTYYGHANAVKEMDFTEYTSIHEGMPEWKLSTQFSGLDWDAPYRHTGNGEIYGGFILAATITPGAKTLWNHNAIFDYTDRYMSIENYQSSAFVKAVWQEYRDNFGEVWTQTDEIYTEVKNDRYQIETYPNPFNLETTISVTLPDNLDLKNISFAIYNVLGQKVKTFDTPGIQTNNKQYFYWNGKNNAGQKLSNGVYTFVVSSPDFNQYSHLLLAN